MNKIYYIIGVIIISLFSLTSSGQGITVRGKVYDAYTNLPLDEVTIQVKDGGVTKTDKDGNFEVNCSESSEITVMHLSYESYKLLAKNHSKSFKIGLIPTSYNLNEVSVSTSRIEPNKNLTQAQSIAIITPKQMEREEGISFDKIINLEPGIYSTPGTAPGSLGNGVSGLSSNIMIRGYAGDRGSAGYKIYLNGIPLTDAEGRTTKQGDVDYSIMGKTEIIKGPSSSLYGVGIGGAIKMSVVEPKPLSTRIVQQLTVGSFGLYRTNTRFESATNNSSIILNYGHQYYGGWHSNNSEQDFATIAGTFRPSDKQTLFFYTSYSNSKGSISNSSLDSASYFDGALPKAPDFVSIKDQDQEESYRIGLSHNYQFSKHVSNLTSVFCNGVVRDDQSFGERTEFNFLFGKDESKIKVKGVIGNELQKTLNNQIKYNKLSDGTNGAMNTCDEFTAFQNNIFTEWNLYLPYNFIFTAGVSYNFMEFGVVDLIGYTGNPINKKSNTGYKTYDPILCPRIALLKSFNDNFSVFANISSGYSPYFMNKTNTITYLGVVDTELKPEHGMQYEIGTKGSLLDKKLSYQVAIFELLIDDKITTQSVYKPNGSILYSWYTNSGSQIDKGIEISASYALINDNNKIISSLQPFVAFTYSDFYYKDFKSDNNNNKSTVDYTDKNVSIPPVLFNAGLDIDLKYGVYLTTTFRYVDDKPGDYANIHYAKGYSIFSAKIGYKKSFGKHFMGNISVGGNNLTNSLYYYSGSGSSYKPAPHTATFYSRLNLSYNF